MKTYEIEDYSGLKPIVLMEDGKFICADTGRKALVSPIVFDNGRKYYDYRNGQRALWYQIQ